MPVRKISSHATNAGAEKKSAVKRARTGLKRAAQGTLLAAGLTVAQWSTDLDVFEIKLFSPGVVDRLRAPITRFHD